MTTFHIIVTGSRPEKVNNKYVPLPSENVAFIEATLAKVAPSDYAALYHGAAAGVDTVADDWAFANGVRIKQHPAYWFDPTKTGNVNKAAGIFRNEAMVRNAKDAVYNKADTSLILLAFYNTPELKDSTGTAHCAEYATKAGLTVRTFRLPVLKGSALQQTVAVSGQSTSMPDPFSQ